MIREEDLAKTIGWNINALLLRADKTHVPVLILGLFPPFSDRLASFLARRHQKKAPISEGQ